MGTDPSLQQQTLFLEVSFALRPGHAATLLQEPLVGQVKRLTHSQRDLFSLQNNSLL